MLQVLPNNLLRRCGPRVLRAPVGIPRISSSEPERSSQVVAAGALVQSA